MLVCNKCNIDNQALVSLHPGGREAWFTFTKGLLYFSSHPTKPNSQILQREKFQAPFQAVGCAHPLVNRKSVSPIVIKEVTNMNSIVKSEYFEEDNRTLRED